VNAENISTLLTSLGCRRLRVTEDKVLATCPFEHEHTSGRDNSPSFVVFVADNDESTWSCSYPHLTPHFQKGGMDHMVRLWAEVHGLPCASEPWGTWEDDGPSLHGLYVWKHDCTSRSKSPERAKMEDLNYDPKRRLPSIRGRYKRPANMPEKTLPTLPESYLERFDALPPQVLKYLREDRGLYDYTIEQWGFLYDSKDNRLQMPCRDYRGKLIATSGRTLINDKTKYKHSYGFARRYYMFGEDLNALAPITPGDARGIIVEGQFDVIRLWQYGYRGAVAMYGANMTAEQIAKFKKLFSSAVALMDGDEAGTVAGQLLQEQFALAEIPLVIHHTPEGLDPGDPKFTLEMAKEMLGEPEVDNDWPL